MTTPEKNLASQAWQDEAGRKWVRLQEKTDEQLEPFGSRALEALGLVGGERVLDIGCGAGQTLLQLGSRVGAAGSVVGVDVSEPLLARALERLREAELTNVELVRADAGAARFERPFDALFSRFGVMFFEDPVAAFQNLRRALRPGGRLSFVCWQALSKNPWANETLSAVRALAPAQPIPALLDAAQPGPYRFADPELVHDVLTRSGFEAVRLESYEPVLWFGGARTLAQAVDYALDIGPAARFVADADPALLPGFRAALAVALAPYVSERGVFMPASTHIVTAVTRA